LDSHDPKSGPPEVRPDANPPAAPPPAPPEAAEDDAPAVEMTFKQWLRANRFTLLIVVILAALIFRFVGFDLDSIWSLAKAAIGLGFVIFIHELGHFLVAKWCDVHVTTFSIGFGPALPGCKFKWGETTYMLALFPLGGYVQMVGQVDGDESDDPDVKEDPRSYKNKTVWQRMAIISAGVIMNVILAFVAFIIVYTHGVERQAMVVVAVDTGSPAYRAGIPTGAVIKEVGNTTDPSYEQLVYAVVNTTHGEKIRVVYQRPQDREATALLIEPRLEARDDRPTIGISAAPALELMPKAFAPKKLEHPAHRNSPAFKATPPFEFGDRIVGTTDPDQPDDQYDPKKVTELPRDPRKKDSDQRDYFVYAQRLRLLADRPVVIRVERGPPGAATTKDITVEKALHNSLGVRMEMGQVSAVRQGSEAAREMRARAPDNSHEGDVIKAVEVQEGGRVTRYAEDPAAEKEKAGESAPVDVLPLDPVRLPSQLLAWARRMQKAGHKDLTVTLHVRRHKDAPGEMHEPKTIVLRWNQDWQDNNEVAINVNSPLSVPGLGLAYRVKTTVRDLDGRVSNGLQKHDVVKNIRLHVETDDGEVKESPWLRNDLEGEQWAHVFWQLHSYKIVKVSLRVERGGAVLPDPVTIEPVRVQDWPHEDRGLALWKDTRLQKANNLIEAVGMGLNDTLGSMGQVYLNLRAMFTGRLNPMENLGGPLTIGVVAFRIAGIDFWQFVFFLGLISINLAVINFLPIPVLDGGHMVFLIYEKIRGKPASENIRVGATYVGLLMLASLMIFVLFIDIKRFFF
jgi:regulator of sigma E protease